jgi:CBS domain-containing protein
MIKTARDIMNEKVIRVRPDTPVNNLISTFLENRISSVPVVDDNDRLIGIVTKTDILGHIIHLDLDFTLKVALKDILGAGPDTSEAAVSSVSELKVSDIMTRDPITAGEDTPVKKLAEMMIENRIHRIIILRGSEIVGILSTLDLLHFIAET